MKLKNTTAAWMAGAATGMALFSAAGAWAMGGNLATHGEALLSENCAKCHAIGAEGESKINTVKPFRDVVAGMQAEGIGAAFIEAMKKKHTEFAFETMEEKAIGDYLEKLKLHLEKK